MVFVPFFIVIANASAAAINNTNTPTSTERGHFD
jgi:hypothetical protein